MNDLDQKRQNEPSLFNEVSLNELVVFSGKVNYSSL